MEPASREGFVGCLRVLQIALPGDVAADHDLAHGLAVPGDFRHGLGVHDGHALFAGVAHTLSTITLGASSDIERIPFGVLGAYGGRTVGFGQTVDMIDVENHPLHALDDTRSRC